jgi:U4/U6.U5 tri-snRNP-associated protein 1
MLIHGCRAVPQAEEFLDAHLLAKSNKEKGEKKKSKKESKAQTPHSLSSEAFMTLPQPLQVGSTGASAAGSPAPRAGFKRIGNDGAEASAGVATPERTKVAFGLSTKRKADDQPGGTPPPKRR